MFKIILIGVVVFLIIGFLGNKKDDKNYNESLLLALNDLEDSKEILLEDMQKVRESDLSEKEITRKLDNLNTRYLEVSKDIKEIENKLGY